VLNGVAGRGKKDRLSAEDKRSNWLVFEIAELLTRCRIRVRIYEQEVLVGFKHAREIKSLRSSSAANLERRLIQTTHDWR